MSKPPANRPPKHDRTIAAQTIAALAPGLTLQQIATAIGCSRNTAKAIALECGYPLIAKPSATKRRSKYNTTAAAIIATLPPGLTTAKLAAAIGCSPSHAGRLAADCGYQLGGKGLAIDVDVMPTGLTAGEVRDRLAAAAGGNAKVTPRMVRHWAAKVGYMLRDGRRLGE